MTVIDQRQAVRKWVEKHGNDVLASCPWVNSTTLCLKDYPSQQVVKGPDRRRVKIFTLDSISKEERSKIAWELMEIQGKGSHERRRLIPEIFWISFSRYSIGNEFWMRKAYYWGGGIP